MGWYRKGIDGRRVTIIVFAAIMGVAFGAANDVLAAQATRVEGRDIVVQPGGMRARPPGFGAGWLAGATDPDPDANESDKSAWQVFIAINKLATMQRQIGSGAVATNNALWETWADDPLTFPASPSPGNPPQWPGGATTSPKKLQVPAQNLIRKLLLQHKSPARRDQLLKQLQRTHPELTIDQLFPKDPKKRPAGVPVEIVTIEAGGGEEVRRNRASFDFIVGNNLWYTQGLAAAFAAGNTIAFPVDAIEVKARWTPISESQKPQFHWNYDSTGTLYGLVALHIMTKALPNWLWATWEWTGNAGRCDYIGCHDSFGVTPANVAPQTPLGGQYPAGALSPALLALFSSAGLGAEWQNYRLKGSQTLFTDTTGQPTLLGNSITEAGFVQSSSCITCHGQASVDKSGSPNPSIGFVSGGQSSNGPLLPSMFYTGASPPKLQYLPIDFVWGILNASPAH